MHEPIAHPVEHSKSSSKTVHQRYRRLSCKMNESLFNLVYHVIKHTTWDISAGVHIIHERTWH